MSAAEDKLLKSGWIPLPFEVVRRRGLFTVRANGLGTLFPKAFQTGPTGDYFSLRGHDYLRGQDAASAFANFLRSNLLCAGSLQRISGRPDGEGIQQWVFWGLQQRKDSPSKAAKAESVADTGPDQAEQPCLRRPINLPGRLVSEFSSGTETLGGS